VKVWEVEVFQDGVVRVRGTNYDLPGHRPWVKDIPADQNLVWLVDGNAERETLKVYRGVVGTGDEVAALNAYENHIHGE
jgi:nucleoside phosphorylase